MSKILNLISLNEAARYLGAILLLAGAFVLLAETGGAAEKYHPLESYTVEYKMEGVNAGEKTHYSQKWGNLVCWVEVSELNMPGAPAQKKNEKVITYVEDGQQWIITINQDDNTGTKMKNPMFEGVTAGMEGKTPKEFSEQFMKQLGGKVIGEKTVNGEKCTEWELMGGARTCITPDQISVESGMDMAGIKMKETAVKINRNDGGPKDICDPGDAKLKEMDMGQMLGQ